MAPNLLVMAQTAVNPHRWFTPAIPTLPLTRTEYSQEPVPGMYKHVPGLGWSLVAVEESPDKFRELEQAMKVVYCRCLHRFLFEDELKTRRTRGFYANRPAQKDAVTFFRMDDGVTWVQCFDSQDNFIPGPYVRFVRDAASGKFRPMLKADDPTWHRGRMGLSTASSAVSSLHCSSGPCSPAVSRDNSPVRHEGPKSRPVSGSRLKVPDQEEARKQKRRSSSRAGSLSRPLSEEDLPHF